MIKAELQVGNSLGQTTAPKVNTTIRGWVPVLPQSFNIDASSGQRFCGNRSYYHQFTGGM